MNLKSLFCSLLLIASISWVSVSNNSLKADELSGSQITSNHLDETFLSRTHVRRVGAKCCDGTNSNATGRGACSHHGGVKYWKMSDKTIVSTGRCD